MQEQSVLIFGMELWNEKNTIEAYFVKIHVLKNEAVIIQN